MSEADYIAYELGNAKGGDIRIKVETDDGVSRWVSITKSDLSEITSVLIKSAIEREYEARLAERNRS